MGNESPKAQECTDAATTLEKSGLNSLVEKSIGKQLLEIVAATEPIGRKLLALQEAQWPVRFSLVIQPAQPFPAITRRTPMVRVRDYGCQKELRRLDNERKSYRPLRLL